MHACVDFGMAFGKWRSTWQLPLTLSFGRLSKCRASRALSESFSQDSDSKLFRTQLVCRFFYCFFFFFFLFSVGAASPFYCGAGRFSFSIKPVKFVKLDKFWTFQVVAWRWARFGWVEVWWIHTIYIRLGMGPLYSDPIRSHPCPCPLPNQWHLIKWRWLLLPHWQIVVVYLAAFWFWFVFDWLCVRSESAVWESRVERGGQSIFLRCFWFIPPDTIK